MPIATAVSFGSFGDIVTIVQLVAQLCDALNGITGAPAEIEALSADLNGYLLVLTLAEDILLREDSSFEPRMRVVIDGGLRRCRDTLLAIQRHVNAFATQHEGRNILLAYLAAAQWRLPSRRKEIAALHARLETQLAFLQLCLGVAQSRALGRTGAALEQILLLAHARPPQVGGTASVLQLYDAASASAYQAFEMMPLRMLRDYVDPLMALVESPHAMLSLLDEGMNEAVWQLLMQESVGATGYQQPRKACVVLLQFMPGMILRTVVFQCVILISGSGEPCALLGVPPSPAKDRVSPLLSAVLQGRFSTGSHPDDSSYAAARRRALHVERITDPYYRVKATARKLARDNRNDPEYLGILSRVQTFPDLRFLLDPAIVTVHEILYGGTEHTFERPEAAASDARKEFRIIAHLLDCVPKLPEDTFTEEERQLVRIRLEAHDTGRVMHHDAFAAIFHALALRDMRVPLYTARIPRAFVVKHLGREGGLAATAKLLSATGCFATSTRRKQLFDLVIGEGLQTGKSSPTHGVRSPGRLEGSAAILSPKSAGAQQRSGENCQMPALQ